MTNLSLEPNHRYPVQHVGVTSCARVLFHTDLQSSMENSGWDGKIRSLESTAQVWTSYADFEGIPVQPELTDRQPTAHKTKYIEKSLFRISHLSICTLHRSVYCADGDGEIGSHFISRRVFGLVFECYPAHRWIQGTCLFC